MKKRIFVLLMTMLLLVGCGKTDVPNTEGNTQQSEMQSETQDIVTEDTQVSEETEEETEIEKVRYTYADLSAVMYTTDGINVRDLPSTDGAKIGSLAKAQEVQVTGKCNETNWYRIKYSDGIGYVSNDYLVDEMPSSWVKDLQLAQNTTQMIVIAGKDTYATVSMHTKSSDGIWVENFSVKGRLGWGGLGKQKEGDGKTPIGIYRFMAAFGIKDNPGVSVLPYLKVDERHHWVDDPNSKYYNQCVSTDDVTPDWKSSEHLYKYVPSYHYSLALNYNEACVPGAGCAIFLHCPNNSFGTTAGCIAIPEENMIQVMQLLRSDCVIIIDYEDNISNY